VKKTLEEKVEDRLSTSLSLSGELKLSAKKAHKEA